MANKVKIIDGQGAQVFPITHVSAVLDDNGNSVEQILGAQTDLINQKQLEIGAVPSDLTPTYGSTNWVTSGGVYDKVFITDSVTRTIDINDLVQNAKYIDSSGVWAQLSYGKPTIKATSVNIPVTPGEIVELTASSTYGSIYALLKSNTAVGTNANFSASQQSRVVLSESQKVTFTIPDDCTLLYVFVHNQRNEYFFPDELKITSLNQEIAVNIALEGVLKDVMQIDNDLYGGYAKTLDLSKYPVRQNFINGSNVWNSNLTTYPIGEYVHILIPAVGGTKFKITANASFLCIYAFLTSDEIMGTPSFVSGYTQRYSITANTEEEITVPSGCEYLYIYKGSSTENFLPTIVQLNNTSGFIDEVKPNTSIYKKGVMMGDSISAGVCSYLYNGSRYNDFFTYEQISDHLSKILGCPFDNVAKRGTGYVADTRNINNAWEQAQVTDYSQYDIVVMMYGVNDYIQHVALGDTTTEASNTVAGNMKLVFNKIFSDNPLCKVVCVGSYNCWGQVSVGGEYTANDTYGDLSTDYGLGYQISGHTLRDYLNMQKAMCEKYHIQFFCLADAGIINTFNIQNELADGLHPTVELRKYIAQEITKVIV